MQEITSVQPSPVRVMTQEQQDVHDALVHFVYKQNDVQMACLIGYAGTGKTFTISRVVETILRGPADTEQEFLFRVPKIAVTAPTHKAVRVLRRAAELGSQVAYGTIHSLLGLKMDVNKNTGEVKFLPSRDPEDQGGMDGIDVIILDEVSMLNRDLFDMLKRHCADMPRLRIIFLGDPCQIPPVGELDSIPLLKPAEHGIMLCNLSTVMRQADGNPILQYATAIRQNYRTGNVKAQTALNDDGSGIDVIQSSDISKIDTILEDHFCSDQFKADADHMKVIAWRNVTVDSFNRRIRNMLYSVPEGMLSLPQLMPGEKLVMDSPYKLEEENNRLLPNNEEVEVVSFEVVRRAFQYNVLGAIGFVKKSSNPQCYKTVVRYKDQFGKYRSSLLWILHESSKAELDAVLREIKQSALDSPFGSRERGKCWVHYYEIEGMFAKTKYNYAITGHKSQGSTYENCMMVEWDIDKNFKTEERNRIKYVAATRARRKLFIIQ